jgi:hypothetical protein
MENIDETVAIAEVLWSDMETGRSKMTGLTNRYSLLNYG